MLSKLIFCALIALIVATAIPYGTVEPWWKAGFVCAVFAISIIALIDLAINGFAKTEAQILLIPMLALALLAFLQTLSLGTRSEANLQIWNTLSADPYQTRFFALQMLALTALLALLHRYASDPRRVWLLVITVMSLAVVSSLFGIVRQSTQQQIGFLLPLLKPNQGYGQFINKNHFAYLMEMAFGLGLGLVLGGGVKKERLMMLVALLLPVWTGLVLANSRGGVIAMLSQIVVAVLLLLSVPSLSPQYRFPRVFQSVAMRSMLLALLAIGVLLGTFWVGGDRLAVNFEAGSSELGGNTSNEGVSRNEIWRTTLKMFADNPIAGVGLGGYWIAVTAYHEASGVMTPQEAHNDYLELLSSAGIIGFALGLWFVVTLVRLARKQLLNAMGHERAVRFGAILGIAGVAGHSLVDFGLHITVNAVVLLVLIMLATTSYVSTDYTD